MSRPRSADDTALLDAMSPAERRARGCYFTPTAIARLLASQVAHLVSGGAAVLDPAAGSGRLLEAVLEEVPDTEVSKLFGVEPLEALARWANQRLGAPCVRVADAFDLLEPASRRGLLGRDYVGAIVANPPYVREKDHRTVLSAAPSRNPSWARFRAPRGDLQQLFLVLGAELLAPGGEMVYLVNPYWLHGDSAAVIREHLAQQLDVLAVVDFGRLRLFGDAPGQHHLILHARRSDGRPPRETRFVRVEEAAPCDSETVCRAVASALDGQPTDSFVSLTRGRGPTISGPAKRWYLPDRRDSALAGVEAAGVRLGELFATHQGVVSGADCVTRRNRRHLTDPIPPLGTGIFVLDHQQVATLGLSPAERRLLRPVYRARDVRPFEVAPKRRSWLLDLRNGLHFEDYPAIADHLERFRPLLARRRECRRGRMPWWRLHWPRDRELFQRPRIVTPRRATRPRFAMAPDGFVEQSDLALITGPNDDRQRLLALLVVLNSTIAAEWFRLRGKHKGRIREYFGGPLEELPLPPVAGSNPVAFARLAELARPEHHARRDAAVAALYGEPGRSLLEASPPRC